MKYTIIISLTLLLMSFHCTDDRDIDIRQDVVFARIYENHAWGHSFRGWLIDNTGKIRGFSVSRNPDLEWNRFNDAGFMELAEMNKNLLQTDTIYSVLNMEELLRHYRMIPGAGTGVLTEAERRGADMGQISYYALQFLHEDKKYRWILLETTGDYIIKNSSSKANDILKWLHSIDPAFRYNSSH